MYQAIQPYRPDINGLRAIAVLLVVGYHAFPEWIKGGFIGVDVFFVISGFLISTLIFENLKNANFSFKIFYGRRVKRLFPSLIVVLASTLVFGWFLLMPDEYQQLGKHVSGSAGFISNYLLWNESGYFDNAADTKPLLHLWSLAIEEQFYFIWPLLLWASWRKKLNWLVCCMVIMILSFQFNLKSIHVDTVGAFYSPQTRFWELLIGSSLACFILYRPEPLVKINHKINTWLESFIDESKDHKAILPNLQSLTGAILLAVSVVMITKEKHFPGWWALLPTLGAVLIIASGAKAWVNCKLLSNRVLIWFGLISFPLYLWHWPLLAFARIITGDVPSGFIRISIIILSILLAWLTYALIEKPIRHSQLNGFNIILLLVAMFLIAAFGYSLHCKNGLPERAFARHALDFTYHPNPLGYLPCEDKTLLNNITLNHCYTNSSKIADAVLFGDSHADDKFYGIVKNNDHHKWMIVGNSSCPPVSGIRIEGTPEECNTKVETVISWLINKPEIKLVALSYFGNYFLTTNYAANHVKGNIGPETFKFSSSSQAKKSRAEIFKDGLSNTIQRLQQAHKQVVLFIDIPELPFLPKDCFRNPYLNCKLSRQEVDVRQSKLRKIIHALQNDNPGLLIFDPINLFCKNQHCHYKDHQHTWYRDSHHLSLNGSNLYGRYFTAWEQKKKKKQIQKGSVNLYAEG